MSSPRRLALQRLTYPRLRYRRLTAARDGSPRCWPIIFGALLIGALLIDGRLLGSQPRGSLAIGSAAAAAPAFRGNQEGGDAVGGDAVGGNAVGGNLVGGDADAGGLSAVERSGDRVANSGWDDTQLAAELGLEPSEYGRMRAAERLGIDDPDLRTALDFLAQRPFRLLPAEERWPVRRVSGQLLRLIRHRASSESEEGWIYECWVHLAEELAGSVAVGVAGEVPTVRAGSTFRVLTRQVPRDWGRLEWQADGPDRFRWAAATDEGRWQVSALTFDLGVSQVVSSALQTEQPNAEAAPRWPTGVAKRLEWRESSAAAVALRLPGAPTVSPGRAEAWARLGRAGFDLGLWDSVAAGQRRPLTPADNEPFYQLLRVSPELPPADAAEPLPIRDLIRQPQEHVGQPFLVRAVVKQVTRVPSDAGDRATQLGVTHYYLLHALVPLPRPLRLKFDGERQIEYSQHFPVVIATRRLPSGLEVGDQARQWVAGRGVFFKLWSYQSQRSQAADVEQWAPLLVADDLQVSGPPDTGNPPWPIGGLLLIPLGLSLLFLLWAGFRSVGR